MRRAFNGSYGITRPFGVYDPAYVNYPGSRHPGTDYGTPSNTPLVANQSGTVTVYNRDASIKTGRGKEVVVTNGNKQTKTCHMNRIDVTNGQVVSEGQLIGLSGYTGYVVDSAGNVGTPGGAHLHNELLIDGIYVNLESNLKEEDEMVNEDEAKKAWVLGMDLPETDPGFPGFMSYWVGKPVSEMLVWLTDSPRHIDIVTDARNYEPLVAEFNAYKKANPPGGGEYVETKVYTKKSN